MKCPSCGEVKGIIRNGIAKNGKQRWLCKCGREFRTDVIDNTKEKWTEDRKSASGSIVTAVKPDTLEDAAKLFKVNLDIWQAKKMSVNQWGVTNKYGNKYTNYQVKVWFEKIQDDITIKSIKEVFDDFVRHYRLPKTYKKEYDKGHSLVEINIADLHLGKLAWHRETGENYDIKIASRRFFDVLDDLIEKTRIYKPKRILFIIGNDFFNADTPSDTTTYGTSVDSDVRWQKRFSVGCHMLVDAINTLINIAPVDVKVILGNHDATTMFSAGELLKAWFHEYPSINIDNSPKLRKYHVYEDVLLGYTHGNKEKPRDLFSLMATEMKNVWNIINFKEFHLGHLHRESSMDYNGLMVRWLKSPTGTDSWHYGKGFLGAVKGAEAFVYKKYEGMVAHIHSNLNGEDYAD